MVQSFEAQVLSMVCEGLFVEFPTLRVVLIEAGFAWLPPLMWRLNKNFRGLRQEVPWLKKMPSEYIQEHFRATTQPMEEPEDPEHLLQIMDMLGRDDFLMFATDYPHFDSGGGAVSALLSCKGVDPASQRKILHDNASAFYGVTVPTKATAA